MIEQLGGAPPFPLMTDLSREQTTDYERITTYLLDEDGEVVQIFPTHRDVFPPWEVVLEEMDRRELERKR